MENNPLMGGPPEESMQGRPANPLPMGGAPPSPSPPGMPNALMGPQGAAPPPPAPPSLEMLEEMMHKVGYISSMLRDAIGKENLSSKDVINGVGHLVAEQVMEVPMAAKYLSDLPSNPDQLRQWLMQHYTSTTSNLKTLASMIQARVAQAAAPMPQASAMMNNTPGSMPGMPGGMQPPPTMNAPMQPSPGQMPPNALQRPA